jgi:hypothetical protein
MMELKMNNHQKKISSIEKNVMSKIQNGEVKMRPRIYYLIVSVFGGLVIVMFGLVNAYFMSVVTLWLRVGAAQGPAYGARRNLTALLDIFPWWALILGFVSLSVVIYFIRKVGNLYKIRLVHLVVLVVAASVLVGFLLSYSALPNMLNRRGASCVVCNSSSAGNNGMNHRQMK